MRVIDVATINVPDKYKHFNCKVYGVLVSVDDLENEIDTLYNDLIDSSWIEKINKPEYFKKCFRSRVKKTVKDLSDKFKEDGDLNKNINSDIGEYLVSRSSQTSLQDLHDHKVVPLSELWLRKVSGNPGFDMLTESPSGLVSFGEAKYKSSGNAHTTAFEQISRFLTENKDLDELADLEPFFEEQSLINASDGIFACIAGFSIDSSETVELFENILNSKFMNKILTAKEFYMVAVQIEKDL